MALKLLNEAYRAALSYAGPGPFWYKVKELKKLDRPAYAVIVRLDGQKRGKHVATVIM